MLRQVKEHKDAVLDLIDSYLTGFAFSASAAACQNVVTYLATQVCYSYDSLLVCLSVTLVVYVKTADIVALSRSVAQCYTLCMLYVCVGK